MSVFSIASYEAEEYGVKVNFTVKLSGVSVYENDKMVESNELGKYMEKAMDENGLSKVFQLGTLLLVIGIVFILFILLKFKNLKLQKNLGRLLASLLFITGGILIVAASFGNEILHKALSGANGNVPEFSTNYGVATFLPFAAAIFILIANIYIQKDMKLLKSADRLR